MKVPEDIRKVKRPAHTVVAAQANKSGTRYYVREIKGTAKNEGRSWNVYGSVIGEIVDGKYVERPVLGPKEPDEVDMQTWALETVVKGLTADILDDLRKVYDEKTAETLYSIAMLRVRRPGIKDSRLRCDYRESILASTYPGLPMSRNKVSDLLEELGLHYIEIRRFLDLRVARLAPGSLTAVDGTLIGDNSTVNSLSDLSRKAKVRGGKEISVLYAYDIEKKEPVCFSVYKGNMMDSKAYSNFIEENDLHDAVLVGDKAFTAESARKEFSDPVRKLHYLFPIRRNSEAIARLDLYGYDSVLKTYDGVSYVKRHDEKNKAWYYSFRDANRSASEEMDYLEKARKSKKGLDQDGLAKMMKRAGTIIYRSDLDMDAEEAYDAYKRRWMIEQMFHIYKQIEELDETRVQADASVIGSYFISFISTIMTCRLIDRLDSAGVLEKMTFSDASNILRKTLRFKGKDGEWTYRALMDKEKDVLRKLDLIPQLPPKRGPGRPRKSAS